MLTFDYNPSNRKIQIRTEDSSLFDKIEVASLLEENMQ